MCDGQSYVAFMTQSQHTIIEEDYAKDNDTDRMSTGLAHLVAYAMMG